MTQFDKKGDTAEFDINEFLSNATRENNEALSKERVRAQEESAPADVSAEKSNEVDTFKEAIKVRLSGDKELASYIEGRESRLDQSEVDEIFSIINSEEKEPEGHFQRLSEYDEKKYKKTVEQETLYSTGEMDAIAPIVNEQKLESDNANSKTTVFDPEYANLTELTVNGDLLDDLIKNDNEDQMKLGLADTKLMDAIKEGENVDTTNIKLQRALGMINFVKGDEADGYIDELDRVVEREVKKELNPEDDKPRFEYRDRTQDDEVTSLLEKSLRRNVGRVFATLAIAIAIFVLELGKGLPIYLSPGRYGLLYILVDMQLLLFGALSCWDNVATGIKGLVKGAPTPDSVMVCSLLVPLLHCVVSCFMNPHGEEIKLFCFCGAVALLINALMKLSISRRNIKSFSVLKDESEKYVAWSLDAGAKEGNEFYDYLLEDSELYTVRKTRFVDGFIDRIERRPKSDDLLQFQLPLIVIAAVIAFVFMYVKTKDIYSSYCAATALACVSLPLSSFIVTTLPVNIANKIAFQTNSTLIGNAVADEYDNAGVISFADSEVFPSKNIKITGFRTYGDNRIDKIIVDLGLIFDKLGGPLSSVFARAIDEKAPEPNVFRIIDVSSDGLIVTVDGRDFYIGRKSFVRKNRFDVRKDESDENFENGNGSVMYVAIGDELAAKIYIKYRISSGFDTLLKNMYNAGMCVCIKTFDPNISNELLERSIKFKKCPIAILKPDNQDEMSGVSDRVSGGIVTNSSMHVFLKMFILCDKIRHSIKTNAIINFISVILSFFIVYFLIYTGTVATFTSGMAMLFQLIWFIPIVIFSFLM